MYYRTIVEAGKTKDIQNHYNRYAKGVKKRASKSKKTPENMRRTNLSNLKTKVRRLLNANFGEGDLYVTLTYKKELRPKVEVAKSHVKKLFTKLRKYYKNCDSQLKYVHVIEFGENSAIHHHIILNKVDGIDLRKIIRKLWEFGILKIKSLDDLGEYGALAIYLLKEKDVVYSKEDDTYMQRYSCSRNLIRPKATKEIVFANHWEAEPIAPEGHYVDKNSITNGVNSFTGMPYQKYTLIEHRPQK